MRSVLRAVLMSFLLLPNLAVLPSAAPARNDSSPRDWQRDLRILIEEIEAVHPDPWFHADRAAVIAATDELYERLPEMSWEESFAGFHRIVAMLRDGHTRVQSHRNPELDLRRAQIQYHLFPDGLRVIAVHPEHAEILGGRVVRIGNADVDEAWAKMEPLVPADNEWTVRGRTPRFLTFADLLVGLGILGGPGECPIEVEKDGRRIRTVVPSSVTHDEAAWPSVLEEADASLPLYLRYPERSYFFEHLPGKDAVYRGTGDRPPRRRPPVERWRKQLPQPPADSWDHPQPARQPGGEPLRDRRADDVLRGDVRHGRSRAPNERDLRR
jgi:hypothetical protein